MYLFPPLSPNPVGSLSFLLDEKSDRSIAWTSHFYILKDDINYDCVIVAEG